MPRQIREHAAGILIFTVLLGYHCFTLLRFPAPFVDEATTGDRAISLIRSGSAMGTMDQDVFKLIPGGEQLFSFFPSAFYALPIYISGSTSVSLIQLRCVNLFFGMLALVAIYVIANSIAGRAYACIALLFSALSPTFAFASHCARPDIIAVALGLCALALHAQNHARSIWPDLAAGLLLGLGFEVHPRICVFGPVLAFLFLARDGWRMFARRNVWVAGLAGLAGLSHFFFNYVSTDPGAFAKLVSISYGESRTPPIFSLAFSTIIRNSTQVLRVVFENYHSISVLFGAEVLLGLYFLLRRRTLEDKMSCAVGFGGYLSALLFVPTLKFFNVIILDPFIRLALAHLAFRACTFNGTKLLWPRLAILTCGILPSAVLVYRDVRKVAFSTVPCVEKDRESAEWIAAFVKPENRIIGPVSFWLALQNNHFSSWENIPFYRRFNPEASLDEVLKFFAPDIFIHDGRIEYFLSDRPFRDNWRENLRVPRSEFMQVLSQRGTLLGQLPSTCNDTLSVYQMNWNENKSAPTS